MRRTLFSPPDAKTGARRRGTAAVEFAVTAPLFMVILLGIAEMSRALDASQRLSNAVREGGRAAASDIREEVPVGSTLNAKIVSDVRNMLTASGINGSKVTITLTYAEGSKVGQAFDLESADNYLQYFKVTASVPYRDVGIFPIRILNNKTLTAYVVFRLGRSTLAG